MVTDLPHDQDIEWGAESVRHFVTDGNATPWQCKNDRMLQIETGELGAELPPRRATVREDPALRRLLEHG